MKEKVIQYLKKYWFIPAFILLTIVSLITYVFNQVTINSEILGKDSYSVTHGNDNAFSLYTQSGYLYKSNQQGQSAALDFIRANPNKIFGSGLNTFSNVVLQRSMIDKQNPTDYLPGTEHYFYQQTIDNIPVYDGIIAIHIQHTDEIYAAAGVVVTKQPSTLFTQINHQKAKTIALNQARKENPNLSLTVNEEQEYLLNLQALGLSADGTTYHVLAVLVTSKTKPISFAKRYFVDLVSGEIVYQENQVETLLSRNISNCNSSDNCVVSRTEGQSSSANLDVNKLYDIFGKVYKFYFNNFNRDSIDNKGATLFGYVNRADIAGFPCPNSAYVDGGIELCAGMDVLDIVAHELTHAVTHYTAGLIYSYQSGALNESNSDIFATGLDHNWSIGEDVHLTGVKTPFRYLNDPTLTGQPDKLFSPLYICDSQDSGGIHTNEGIMNKAFYLMTQGGSFNGCQINGIGSASYQIQYRALTHYLIPSANFSDMYIDMLLACNDLYGGYSDNCINVEKALQATEMDQQPVNTQQGAVCLNRTEVSPACSSQPLSAKGITSSPTLSPDGTVSLSATPSANLSMKVIVYTDNNNNGYYDGNEGIANVSLTLSSGGQQFSGVTDTTGGASFFDFSFGQLQLTAQLSNGTALGPYSTDISQTGNYLLEWKIPADLLQQANTALPGCKVISKCSHGAGGLQLCTFECQ